MVFFKIWNNELNLPQIRKLQANWVYGVAKFLVQTLNSRVFSILIEWSVLSSVEQATRTEIEDTFRYEVNLNNL